MTREHRKMLLFYTSAGFLTLTCLSILQLILGELQNRNNQLGTIVGLILGVLASCYIQTTWKTRIDAGQKAIDNPPASGCLVPFVVTSGTCVGGTLLSALEWNVLDIFSFALVYFLLIFFGFVMVKTFFEKVLEE